ncbi:glycosyltransferase family 2 protein [Alphaproteobacteria bacterium]|nr:glycosyltransferase family 2 protein [Alphaproteobacteria bacterium]
MGKYQVVIVIPAFNEENTIFDIVQLVKEYGFVVVVNDASKDKTKQLAEDAGAIVVSHNENRGYDGSLNSGFLKAKELNCDVVITFDADGQHNQKYIKEYIDLIEQGFDLVIGTRNRLQRVAEYIFSWVASWRWGVKDPLCGMKGYRIDIYNQLGFFDSYGSIGTELAIFAAHKNIKIAQHSIKIEDRQDKPRFGRSFTANMVILRSLWLGFRKYKHLKNRKPHF